MNRQDACEAKSEFYCGTGILPVLEKGTRCEYESTFSEVAKLTRLGLWQFRTIQFIPVLSNAAIIASSDFHRTSAILPMTFGDSWEHPFL